MITPKTLKLIALCIAVVLVFALVGSCGSSKLKGTYVSTNPWAQVTKLVFQGNRVTVTDISVNVRCSYKLKDDRLVISGTTTLLGTEVAVDYDYAFEKKGDSIFLDGQEFVKQ